MNTTFKKSLLAVALSSISAGAFAAADITVGSGAANVTAPVAASIEGNPDTITVADIAVVLDSEYAVGDVITFTFSGDAFDTTTSASSLNPTLVDANDTMTLGRITNEAGVLKYRITELTYDGNNGDTTIGGEIELSNLDFNGTEVFANGGVTVTYSAAQAGSGDPIDSSGANLSQQIIFAGEEFTASVDTEADAVIDVQEERLLFTPDAVDTIVFDTALTTQVDSDGDGVLDLNITEGNATLVTHTYTVSSDFSWVVDTDANTSGVQAAAGTFALANCAGAVGPTVTATSVEFSCTAGAANTTLTIDPKQTGATFPAALTPKSFTTDVTTAYTDDNAAAQTETTSNLDSGEWTLNGSQVRVPYLVVNNSRFGIIANVTNHGSQTGDIVLDVWAEDGTLLTDADGYVAGSSTPGSIVSVASALKTVLTTAGYDLDNTTKFSFQITTNVPEDDIFVYAAYTDSTTAERAIVNTDAKVQTK